jgi:hypothetical protein
MAFFDMVHALVTGILIGYLSFANTCVDRALSLLPPSLERYVSYFESKTATESTGGDLSRTVSFFSGTVPKVLLEHKEFQTAAVAASLATEATFALPPEQSLHDAVSGALVNIFCQYKTDKYIRTTTGTGFFINQKGVIITNAHVAQFLLLEKTKRTIDEVECVIRSGNPAVSKYKAELLYISPKWVFENAQVIAEEAPTGTGERDYALLYVSESVDSTELPEKFPAIPVSTVLLSRGVVGAPVIAAGYPAEALIRGGADIKLLPVIASPTIGSLYTFGSNFADIFSITESPVGEQGASGGPVASESERVAIGLIVTKGDIQTEGVHSLRALTLSYIDRTILEETGFSLSQNMQGTLAERGAIFKKAMAPFLAGILEASLTSDGQ